MTHLSFQERVDRAFGAGAPDAFADQYLALTLARWGEVQASARRTGIAMAALVAAFLLLTSARNGATIDVGPLKLASAGTILVWIPAVVSFLGLEVVTLQMGCWRYDS
jgi:hypothetical protein